MNLAGHGGPPVLHEYVVPARRLGLGIPERSIEIQTARVGPGARNQHAVGTRDALQAGQNGGFDGCPAT